MPGLDRVEGLYDALEIQGEALVAEWLWPPTWEALRARLTSAEQPVHVLCLDAALVGGDLLFESAAGEAEAVTAAQLGGVLRESARISQKPALVILLPGPGAIGAPADRSSADPGAFAAALHAASGLPALLLSGALTQHGMAQAAGAWLAALVAGQSLAGALAAAQRSLLDRSRTLRRPLAAAGAFEPGVQLVCADPNQVLVPPRPAASRGLGQVVRFPDTELTPAWQALPEPPAAGGPPPEPPSGYYGRAAELRALERALWAPPPARTVWV
ncbi:MAG: hypothetical protein V1772_11970, partial [Chloroflexota bacterium]